MKTIIKKSHKKTIKKQTSKRPSIKRSNRKVSVRKSIRRKSIRKSSVRRRTNRRRSIGGGEKHSRADSPTIEQRKKLKSSIERNGYGNNNFTLRYGIMTVDIICRIIENDIPIAPTKIESFSDELNMSDAMGSLGLILTSSLFHFGREALTSVFSVRHEIGSVIGFPIGVSLGRSAGEWVGKAATDIVIGGLDFVSDHHNKGWIGFTFGAVIMGLYRRKSYRNSAKKLYQAWTKESETEKKPDPETNFCVSIYTSLIKNEIDWSIKNSDKNDDDGISEDNDSDTEIEVTELNSLYNIKDFYKENYPMGESYLKMISVFCNELKNISNRVLSGISQIKNSNKGKGPEIVIRGAVQIDDIKGNSIDDTTEKGVLYKEKEVKLMKDFVKQYKIYKTKLYGLDGEIGIFMWRMWYELGIYEGIISEKEEIFETIFRQIFDIYSEDGNQFKHVIYSVICTAHVDYCNHNDNFIEICKKIIYNENALNERDEQSLSLANWAISIINAKRKMAIEKYPDFKPKCHILYINPARTPEEVARRQKNQKDVVDKTELKKKEAEAEAVIHADIKKREKDERIQKRVESKEAARIAARIAAQIAEQVKNELEKEKRENFLNKLESNNHKQSSSNT